MIQYAIPTYDRPALLQKTTLAYLDRCGIEPELVTIWISGEEQQPLYADLPERWLARCRVGAKGLVANRIAAEATYPEGTHLVWINDDVKNVQRLNPASLVEANLVKLAEGAFKICAFADAYLWGVYPVANGLLRLDLRHIVGACYGVRLRHDDELQPTRGDPKEDYERTLRFFRRDGSVVRLDDHAVETTYYNDNPPVEPAEANVAALERDWPGWIRRNPRRKSPYPEILLRDARAS
jgi:hypothetical protein